LHKPLPSSARIVTIETHLAAAKALAA
jgi:hypothetical protein